MQNAETVPSLKHTRFKCFSVGFQNEFCFLVKGKVAPCKSQASASKIGAKNRLTEQPKHRCGKLVVFGWLYEKSIFFVPDELGDAAHPRGNHRFACSEGLRDDDRLRLAQGRHNQNIESRHDVRNIFPVAGDNYWRRSHWKFLANPCAHAVRIRSLPTSHDDKASLWNLLEHSGGCIYEIALTLLGRSIPMTRKGEIVAQLLRNAAPFNPDELWITLPRYIDPNGNPTRLTKLS